MKLQSRLLSRLFLTALTLGAGHFYACGRKAPPTDKNLLENASFEEVKEGTPARWKIENFRGLQDADAAVYGVSDSLPYDGDHCFFFRAGPRTARFYTLTQEVWVKGARRVRLRGAIRTKDVGDRRIQYPQSSFALTYYNEDHERFESSRFADVRTEPKYGSTEGWEEVDEVYRLPLGTTYVVVHCVLGMQGEIWFDDVSLVIPAELPWQEIRGENFTHYWLDKPYPEGSIAFQQQLFDSYAERLGIPKKNRPQISYYLYPDTASIHAALGTKHDEYFDARRHQIHSIHPAEDHEIVHFLTDPYGTLPNMLMEGTAFYLMGEFGGAPIKPQAQALFRSGKLLSVRALLDPTAMSRFDPAILVPTAATFIGYLLETQGSENFLELHRVMPVNVTYGQLEEAFVTAYGKSLSELESGWRESIARDISESKEVAP